MAVTLLQHSATAVPLDQRHRLIDQGQRDALAERHRGAVRRR
jgi:hypothetical protein